MTTYHEGPFRNWLAIHFPSCPEDLLSGLVDPQQPTMIDVEQEDGSVRQEFSRYWPKAGGGSQTDPRLSPTALVNSPAGMYTGAMRGLVQDQLGRGGGVAWDFRHARSHGIYTASDESIWAVEISSSGVRAAHLEKCPFEAGDTVIGFSTSTRSFPGSRAVQIAPASTVSGAYGGRTPIWPECGWAFSASGGKAANVVIGQPASYMVAYLYEITISETTYTIDGESVQGPGSATMALVESGFFWGDRVTHIRHPRYAAPQSLVSFDWFRGQITAPDDEFETPVHVRYEGETRQVVRYIRQDLGGYTHTDGSTGTSGRKGFTSEVFGEVPISNTTSGPFDGPIEHPRPTICFAGNNASSARQKLTYSDGRIRQDRVGEWTERSDAIIDIMTFPFWDREGYYHARRTTQAEAGTITDSQGTYVWLKRHYKQSNIANAWTFDRLSCADASPIGHPEPFGGDVKEGQIIWDAGEEFSGFEAATPALSRLGEIVGQNDGGYFNGHSAGCEHMVGGGSAFDCGQNAYDKRVELGQIDDNTHEFAGVISNPPAEAADGDLNTNFRDRWTAQYRRLSDGEVFNLPSGATVQHLPLIFIEEPPGVSELGDFNFETRVVDTKEHEYELGVLVRGSTIELGIDETKWEELRIYDSSAQTQQRLLITAPDASAAALQAHLTGVFPQQGTIGELLEGSGSYPYGSVTSTIPSWIGKP
jgi:hypothetical protein